MPTVLHGITSRLAYAVSQEPSLRQEWDQSDQDKNDHK